MDPGPLTRRFTPENRELSIRAEYVREQAIQMCGRLLRKVEQLERRHELLLGGGRKELADTLEKEKERYEQLLELAEGRRDHSDRVPSESSRNPVLERVKNQQEKDGTE